MMLPASHANFLIANGTVFVPVPGGASDDPACRVLEEATGLHAEPIMARWLVVGLGSLHCVSCQQVGGTDQCAECPNLAWHEFRRRGRCLDCGLTQRRGR